MRRSKFFSRFITVTLTVALLLSMGSRAIRVSALADPIIPEIAPVFDTQIYQLQDYIDNGGLSSDQLDIFYTLAGFYAVGQIASYKYQIRDPYTNSSNVWDWLKSCGIQLYNTVIGFVPDTMIDPINGNVVSNLPTKEVLMVLVADLMGCALEASTFEHYSDWQDEVENSSSYWLPWNLDVQKGLNSIFGIFGGVYNWQFSSQPFESTFDWKQKAMSSSIQTTYNTYMSQLMNPGYGNSGAYSEEYRYNWNLRFNREEQFILFIDTDDNIAHFVYPNGSDVPDYQNLIVWYFSNSPSAKTQYVTFCCHDLNISTYTYTTYLDLVNQIISPAAYNDLCYFDTPSGSGGGHWRSGPKLSDMFTEVYVGTNWLNKNQLFNLSDLNIEESDPEYYTAVPEDHDYLIDILGILNDILNNTNLYQVFIDNLFTPDGVPVHDYDLIRITTDIYNILDENNPPLPVNLNDIATYTNNTYLDIIKERATSAGNTFASLIAFWHNCDPEIIYVMFGASIMILVGAFIGKWGHS